jgi:putative spermidine/putrescine transport system ATP-binding protein
LRDSVATLRIGGITFSARVRDGVKINDAGSLFVRPERVQIGSQPGAAGAGNRVAGRVKRVSFLGNIVRYVVAVSPTANVIVDVQNSRGPPLATETPVVLDWAVEDSLVLGG